MAPSFRGVAQFGSAFGSGPKGRGFKSRHLDQLSPHVLIQSMRTSFCIYRLINRHNKGYNYQIWAIYAGDGLLGVILSDEVFCSSALFSLLMTAFRGRNQRFIMECTLLWTIAGYRPQCKVPSQSIAKQRLKHAHFIILPAIRDRSKWETCSNTA